MLVPWRNRTIRSRSQWKFQPFRTCRGTRGTRQHLTSCLTGRAEPSVFVGAPSGLADPDSWDSSSRRLTCPRWPPGPGAPWVTTWPRFCRVLFGGGASPPNPPPTPPCPWGGRGGRSMGAAHLSLPLLRVVSLRIMWVVILLFLWEERKKNVLWVKIVLHSLLKISVSS